MKLWIFGDSFSVLYNEELPPLENNFSIWSVQLAKLLGCDTIEYRSGYGYANEYIFKTVVDDAQKIHETDYVLVQLTDPSRRWFLENDPTYGNYHNILDSQFNEVINKKTKQAVKGYISCLHHPQSDSILYQQCFYGLYTILNITASNQWKIIPGFEPCPEVNGTMSDIANLEFINDIERKKWYKHYGVDPRQNHMSKENHTIFANKLYQCLSTESKELNLSDSFKKEFIKC